MSKVKDLNYTRSIGDVIINPENQKKYIKGRFLGKGGFARCYELTDAATNQIYAGKVVSKTVLSKTSQKEKIAQEISIHRELSHKHVVKFYEFFEDKDNVYIILELCNRRSLMEMHKRRRYLTDREARYFVRQIALGCVYLHEKKIIHRDLKLGNLFLNDNMELKLGDFGLATRVENNERKKTLCGTPNYIAPEILSKKGHSYEVDSWSLGCILYTLLVGRPPFETNSLKETYSRIRKNEYNIPSRVPTAAKNLIKLLLHTDPQCRPRMKDVMTHEYIVTGPAIPSRLPTSCLTTIPRADDSIWQKPGSFMDTTGRKPLAALNEPNNKVEPVIAQAQAVPALASGATVDKENHGANNDVPVTPPDCYLSNLHSLLVELIRSKPADRKEINEEEALDPAAKPVFWISKWVDYTDKYGLGYQLCDNSSGVLFNDFTRIIQLPDGINFHYVSSGGTEEYCTMDNYPDSLKKKVVLLQYFKDYMQENLVKTGELVSFREGDELIRMPYLKTWFRTRNAIVLVLTNGTVQLNFFEDHTKLILCPLMEAVSYINKNKEFTTYRFKKLAKYGCSKELYTRLRYAKPMVEKLLSSAQDKS